MYGRPLHEVTFEVSGQPVPQPRPRVVTVNGRGMAYVPRGHAIHPYREAVALMARAAGIRPQAGPVALDVVCVIERPASHWSKSGLAKSAPAFPPMRAGDWDNLGKGVCDALVGVAFEDDSQVVDGRCRKWYAERGEKPRTVVTVSWW